MLPSRQHYLARAYETLARCYALNGKRREALSAVDRSLELDSENESFLERREELKSRG